MLMIVKIADGSAVVCEEHEIADAIKSRLDDEAVHESADWLQFQVMRREDTRRRQFALGVALWR